VSVLWSIGEAGKHEQRRVRVVHHSRAFFGLYYVSRTTHDVVIAQLSSRCKEILARRHFGQRRVPHLPHCEGQFITDNRVTETGFSCGERCWNGRGR
jgi:hypothetical protein